MGRQIRRFGSRDEWLAARVNGIGASEVPAILGLSPYETPYSLWWRKKHPEERKEETMPMILGHLMEDAVAQLYSRETGAYIIKNTQEDFFYVNDKYPCLQVSPDRVYWEQGMKHNEANKCIFEAKTTQKSISAEDIPDHWYIQVMTNLGVAEMQNAALGWLTSGRTFGYTDIEYNDELFGTMWQEVEKFWRDYIIGDAEPPAATVADVMTKFARSQGVSVEASDELYQRYCDLREVKVELDRLEEQKGELESAIKVAMQGADTLTYKGTTLATWKSNKDGEKFDDKRFVKENPELVKPYMIKTVGARRFSLK